MAKSEKKSDEPKTGEQETDPNHLADAVEEAPELPPAPAADAPAADGPIHVRLLKTVAGPKLTGQAGHAFSLQRSHAEELVRAGAAVEITAAECDQHRREPNMTP